MLASRRKARLVAMAAPLALLALARAARADNCGAPLVSTCINDDNLWPHAGPSQFLAVGGTETVESGHVGFGLVTSYLSRPILVHTSSPNPFTGTDAPAVNDQVNGTFLWSYGVTPRLEVDAALPITFGQGGAGASPITGASSGTAFQDTALRDLRFGFAYALVPRARVNPHAPRGGAKAAGRVWALTARMEVSAPTGDQNQFAGERTAVWIPSIAADYRRGRWFAGAEIGARLRPATEFAGARVGSQGVIGLGLGFDILKRELLSAAVEARALPNFAEQHDTTQSPTGLISNPNGKYIAPAEWALSARSAPLAGGDFTIQLGGGGPIPFSSDAAITNPRFRFTLSLRYEPLGRDTDGDGVLDKDDKCPTVHGVAGNPAGEGCPKQEPLPAAAPPSSSSSTGEPVHLDLTAGSDRCPAEPEMVEGFSDDGCPDVDSDKDGVPDRYDRCPLVPEDFVGLQDGCPESAPPAGGSRR